MTLEKPDFPRRKIELPGEQTTDKTAGRESHGDWSDKQKEEFSRGKKLFTILSKIGEQKRFLLDQGKTNQRSIEISLSDDMIIIKESSYGTELRHWELRAGGTVRMKERKPGYVDKDIPAGRFMMKQRVSETRNTSSYGDDALGELEKIVQKISGQTELKRE